VRLRGAYGRRGAAFGLETDQTEVKRMGLKEDLTKDITTAMKSGEKLKTTTLRLLLNAIKNKEIELRRPLEDSEASSIVAMLIRQRHDSIEQFRKGGRTELAEKEASEIEILKAYMPEQLTEDEISEIVKKAAEEIGAESMKEMGRLMKEVMEKIKGKADGRVVSEIVKKTLGG
jgi:uncharacterized protein YqeY